MQILGANNRENSAGTISEARESEDYKPMEGNKTTLQKCVTVIHGRTPEDIKKGLWCCMSIGCPSDCPYINCDEDCNIVLNNDAIACIKYFEDQLREATKKIERLERERDAAVEQLKEVDRIDLFSCSHCKNEELSICEFVDCENCDKDCPCATCVDMSNWQWCGASEVE